MWGFSQSKINEKNELIYLNSPAIGDIYEYKIETSEYSTLKVISISIDIIFVSQNEYVIDRMSKVYKIDKDENYSDYNYGISKIDLKKMYDDKIIYDINRK